MWTKGSPLTLLVGVQTGTATMENSMEISLKTTNRAKAIPVSGIYSEKNILQKDTCTPMFTAARFIIAKTLRQPKIHQHKNE